MLDSSPPDAGNDAEGLVIVRFDDIHVPTARVPAPPRARVTDDPRLNGLAPLSRADAEEALASLRQIAGAVDGVDVVHMVGERPDYVLQTWRCDPGVGETPAAFSRRVLVLAEEFIAQYPDPGDGSVRYALLGVDPPLSAAA